MPKVDIEIQTKEELNSISSNTCQREIGNLLLKWLISAFAFPQLPSLFSKSMGLTLWGIVEDPISPALVVCTHLTNISSSNP